MPVDARCTSAHLHFEHTPFQDLWSAKLSLPSPSRRCEVLELAVDLVQIKGLWIKFATDPVHHLLMLGVLRVLYTRCSSFLALTFHQGESGSCVDRSSSR